MRIWPDLCAIYESQSGFSGTTLKTYGGELARLQATRPGVDVWSFTETDLIQFIRAASSPGSQTKRRNILCSFFKWCERTDRLNGVPNPARNLCDVVKPGVQGVKHHNWLTKQQVRDLWKHTIGPNKEIRWRDQLVLLIPLSTGLRRAELAALTWEHISMSDRTLQVRGKGGKCAELGLPDQLFYTLGCVSLREGSVILGLGESGISDVVRKYGKLIGVPTLAPHDLRRTFADLLLQQTGDILAVSKAMRHSSVGTTQRYLENSPRKVVEIGKAFKL